MLILSRKKEESLIINDNIEIKILEVVNGAVKIGIVAPKEVTIHRKEVHEKIRVENSASASSALHLRKLIKKSSEK